MSQYKINFEPREKIDEKNISAIKIFTIVDDIRVRLRNAIKRHHYLIDLREEIAMVADEYMKSYLNQISSDENRRLLVQGCTFEIDEISEQIEKIKIELDALMYGNE